MKDMKRIILTLLIAMLLPLGIAAAQSALDPTTAENIALEAAGVTRDHALLFPTETETEQGQTVYDIEFKCDGLEFEYWISATDGAIVKHSWELTSEKTLELAGYQDAAAAVIGESQALAKALADANLTNAQATMLEVNLDVDDQLRLYKVKFYTLTAEYEYEVDAVSGAICGMDIEFFAESETVRPGQSATDSRAQDISCENARTIALDDAALATSDAVFTKTKLDREDGRLVYEVEFMSGDAVYEYEIDAATGAIREKSFEVRATARPSQSVNYIGVDQAKNAALSDAGLSASDVSFAKAKLEKDDGMRKYEIEFRKDGTEYEYEIDADTGAILERDIERDAVSAALPDSDRDHDDDDDGGDDDHHSRHDDDDDDDGHDDDDHDDGD